jgi:hypothetical protein
MSSRIIKELFLFPNYKIIVFITIFVLLITNFNVFSKNTYLKYSPSEDALLNTVNPVIIVCDKPSSIGLTFFEMKGKLTISSHKRYDILLKEFHPTLNGELKLSDFNYGSHKKIWWKCDVAEDHIWEANINNRINGSNCPCCHGLKVVMSNCLATTHPNIAKQWHPTKNNGLTPFDFTMGSEKRVWWKCDEGDDHEWESGIKNIVNGNKCPCCVGKKTVLSNCLATTHPDVAKQWHPTKNLSITPFDVTALSNKKVWWKCDKHDDHEWESTISNKTRNSIHMGCPCCAGNKVVLSTCLATTHPNIIEKWHPTKNSITPFDISFGSSKRIWWKCNNNHEWIATVNWMVDCTEKGGNGCPLCNESVGEKKIKNILDTLGINYEVQKRFEDCKHKRTLPFDFYLPNNNMLIEYDGIQHFKSIEIFGGSDGLKQTEKRDKIKNEYATKNNIHLLRIPYTKFDSIEDEIKKFFQTKQIY